MSKLSMKRLLACLLLLLVGAAVFLFPEDKESKERFSDITAPKTSYSNHMWIDSLPAIRYDDGCDIVRVKVSEDTTASTGFITRSNGQGISINLTGKAFVSARVRFRGVDDSKSTIEYFTSTITYDACSSAGREVVKILDHPSVPKGYLFDCHTYFASVSTSKPITLAVSIPVISVKSEYGRYLSTSQSLNSPRSGPKDFYAWTNPITPFDYTFSVGTRGAKIITTETHTQDPSCGSVKYSGILDNGRITEWYSINLDSNSVNTLYIFASGSGLVDVEIEYTFKFDSTIPSSE